MFENEGKIFKKLKQLAVFLRSGNCESNEFSEIGEVRVSGKFRMFKFNGAMHKLLVGECLTGAKSVC